MPSKKPSVAIAHIVAKTFDVKKTTKFYCTLGMTKIWQNERMSIVELRGGTHILFFKQDKKFKKPFAANFDLMVDDIKKFRAKLKKSKIYVSAIESDERSGHEMFEVTDPDGRIVIVFSSHTEGRPV